MIFTLVKIFLLVPMKRIMFSLSFFILKKKITVYSVDNLVSHELDANLDFEKKWIDKIVKSSNIIICTNQAAKKSSQNFTVSKI